MNREAHIARLKRDDFDLLVIGGGATGTGIALDAATRHLNVALVERDDFAAGTSSRSTKLIHGGVRYLEQAVKRLDRGQFNLVRDALAERATLVKIAPHLAQPLPIITPLYGPFQVPYVTVGLKLYDLLAGRANLAPSRFITAQEARDRVPMLNPKNLWGAVIYYDGQFDDARMNVTLALTAADEGAAIANHVAVTGLQKDAAGRLCGATVRDNLTGDTWAIAAKVILNAAGPFCDAIRQLDDPTAAPVLRMSSGVHIVLDAKFAPPATGLLIPETEDGRLLFLLPWRDRVLAGTTDNPATLTDHPQATEGEIEYILRHLRRYFALPVDRGDVLASWSGLRPLVANLKAADTAKLSRDHVINRSASGLLTVTGGKWTTYRKMAADAVNVAIAEGGLNPDRASQTAHLKLLGAKAYGTADAAQLQTQLQTDYGLDAATAHHLKRSYGDRAIAVAQLAQGGYGAKLAPQFPYLEAEVIYAVRHEAARTPTDVLARRTRLGFLDTAATIAALPRVVDLMGDELHWSSRDRHTHTETARAYFQTTPPLPEPVPQGS
jgi:glycerol-3-phosphate dehydrogenase